MMKLLQRHQPEQASHLKLLQDVTLLETESPQKDLAFHLKQEGDVASATLIRTMTYDSIKKLTFNYIL